MITWTNQRTRKRYNGVVVQERKNTVHILTVDRSGKRKMRYLKRWRIDGYPH